MTAAEIRETLVTLAIGAAGAALFWVIGFPAAILTGPAAAVSLATLMGVPTLMPARLRDAVFVVIGVTIGSTVTPEVIATALTWPISLAVLVVTLVAIVVLAQQALMRSFAYDRMTALLCATPGHLSYVLTLSTELNADVPRVALVQTVRVLLLTLAVPVLIALWGVEGEAYLTDYGTISYAALAVTLPLAVAVGWVFLRLHVPAALVLGGMAVSAIGHGSGLTPGVIPAWLQIGAFLCMGTLIGTRFRGFDPSGVWAALGAGVVTTIVACAVASVGAIAASWMIGLPAAALLLAFAPGGVEVMAAIAVETGLEPALVAAHHVFRLLALTVLVPIMIARARARI